MQTNSIELPPAPLLLSVQYAVCDADMPTPEQVKNLIHAALVASRVDSTNAEITVRFIDEKESAALNGKYRNKPYATNVLSFNYQNDSTGGIWGDIAVCAAVICREAKDLGISPPARYAHIIVHGVLHLAGYHHDTPAAAAAMETIETATLAQFSITDPYQ